ncbi:RagB/SusD family nutrient uptake outer membrane protein [Arachidicoccus soli]|uniref:RagB/SusD family nutrient uptake outer membrane protein n=1 Tax=Arachidicoccus soli TaxID=2341117 RepID=A0A386HTR6_9BACT|nr:RagB/SusD family nutrient uptake outer membrane protein [Arachidicoccus soli]AYD49069.1 RagB/SusD family nutrient uptake outer membrane protein [Arachidicoccus soli]
MMKIKINNAPMGALLLIAVMAISGSCKKFLDKKSNTSLVEPTTLNDLQELLDDGVKMNSAATPSYGEVSADDYFVTPTTFTNLSMQDQQYYSWQPVEQLGSGNDWGVCYEKVYNSNYCLDQLKNISVNAQNLSMWDNVKGSALFFRSYYFLELLGDYAKAYDSATASRDLGIALRLSSDFNIPSVRASVVRCYQEVIQDTKQAAALLPPYGANELRPSKMTAYGLLARTYLRTGIYDEALLYADSCLQLNHHLINFNGDEDIKTSITAKLPFKQFNKETIFYTEMNKNGGLQRTDLKSRIDTVLYRSYATNDLRKAAFFSINADGYPYFKGSYSTSLSTLFSGIATDEMLLTRAECFVRVGQIQKGVTDLNNLLMMRYKTGSFIPYTISSQKSALDTILLERRKELVMRGLRWTDLKRLNKEGASITIKRTTLSNNFTLFPNANFYALPIPSNIIQITGMPQNPE